MKRVFSNRGHTLVEIMIALGLVGLVSMGIFSISQDTLKNIQSNKLSTTRDQLATEFRQSAGRVKYLHASLPKSENVAFYNCVCGKGSGCTSAKEYTDLVLYDDSKPDGKAIKRYYDYSGIPCENPAASSCAIRVRLSFLAQCKPTLPSADPTPPFNCTAPVEFFAIRFVVEPNEDSIPSHKDSFKFVSGSAYTQVSTLLAGSSVCD